MVRVVTVRSGMAGHSALATLCILARFTRLGFDLA